MPSNAYYLASLELETKITLAIHLTKVLFSSSTTSVLSLQEAVVKDSNSCTLYYTQQSLYQKNPGMLLFYNSIPK